MPHYKGACDCEAVQFACEGEPLFTQHCHCNKCREVAASSTRKADKVGYGFTAAYLKSNFEITSGSDKLEEIIKNDSKLLLCQSCHCLIYGISQDPNKQAGIGINFNNFIFTDSIPESFKFVRHIWYANRIVNINDELPKYKDTPEDQFGSGKLYSKQELEQEEKLAASAKLPKLPIGMTMLGKSQPAVSDISKKDTVRENQLASKL